MGHRSCVPYDRAIGTVTMRRCRPAMNSPPNCGVLLSAKEKVAAKFRESGYTVQEEYPIGNGKTVDLVACKNGKLKRYRWFVEQHYPDGKVPKEVPKLRVKNTG